MHCIHSALTFPQDSANTISSQKNPSIQRSSQPSISSIPNASKQDSRKNGPGRRVEEHLVTANFVLDKADAAGIPVWIIGLDLSKAFARVHWLALWTAPVDEEIPIHPVWILQCVYFRQCGEVVGDIGGATRQGRVLNPRLFCSVLQWPMREWRAEVGNVGFFFFSLRSFFLAEGLFWMTVLLGSLQAAPFLYRRLRMCMKGWAKSKPQLLRGGLGDGW